MNALPPKSHFHNITSNENKQKTTTTEQIHLKKKYEVPRNRKRSNFYPTDSYFIDSPNLAAKD